jgi:hypothetical protein
MELRCSLKWATLASCMVLTLAIPASLIEEIKASELRNNKGKYVERLLLHLVKLSNIDQRSLKVCSLRIDIFPKEVLATGLQP